MSNCARSKFFSWCKELPADYADKEGKRYCIFHAPRGYRSEIGSDEFTDLLVKKIAKDMREKGLCHLSGTVFEWPIRFKDLLDGKPLQNAAFSEALFHEKADFSHITFQGKSLFSGALFYGEANFEYARFCGNADFSGTLFHGEARFFDAFIEGNADFSRATFEKASFFSWGAFKGKVIFKDTNCKEKTIFKRPVF